MSRKNTNSQSPDPTPAALHGGDSILHNLPSTRLGLIERVRKGLPATTFEEVHQMTRISRSSLASALSIPQRTLARRKREGLLSPEESVKIIRLYRVVTRGREVFGNEDTALKWLQTPNRSLGGSEPLSLLDTDIGGEIVLDTLGRLEHGVFA